MNAPGIARAAMLAAGSGTAAGSAAAGAGPGSVGAAAPMTGGSTQPGRSRFDRFGSRGHLTRRPRGSRTAGRKGRDGD